MLPDCVEVQLAGSYACIAVEFKAKSSPGLSNSHIAVIDFLKYIVFIVGFNCKLDTSNSKTKDSVCSLHRMVCSLYNDD